LDENPKRKNVRFAGWAVQEQAMDNMTHTKRSLILVDQTDFCPGGALAVPNGHEVIGAANPDVQQQAA
jgi:hypothetical protein